MFIDDIGFYLDNGMMMNGKDMNDNGLNNSWINNTGMNNNGMNNNGMKNGKLFDSSTGFLKGNMFRDEYMPYKNYKPSEMMFSNEREKLLYKVSEMCFALNDISLYLDIHPDDNYMYSVFKEYVKKYKEYEDLFEKNYGSLDLNYISSNNYLYYKNPWPWDNDGGVKYV